jgi:hypothetical protein
MRSPWHQPGDSVSLDQRPEDELPRVDQAQHPSGVAQEGHRQLDQGDRGMTTQSPTVWLVREWGLDIYKDGKLVGTIPPKNFPILISDLALNLDRSLTAAREESPSAADQ